MSNKLKCGFFIIILITLICQRGNAQRISFPSRPYEFQASDESSEYNPFASEYSNNFGKLTPNQPPSELSNTKLSFVSANNAQNGFQRGSGSGSFGTDEKDRRAWNHEENADSQRGNGYNWSQNGEKTQVIGSFSTPQYKKISGSGNISKWNSGFRHTESGNQMNGNSFLDFGSNPPKRNNGFNTNSGIQKEDFGNREYQVPAGKKTPGGNWNAHPNNWNSGFNPEKEQGLIETGTNSWKPEDSKHFPNQFKPFQTSQIKPGGSSAVTNQWNTDPTPDKINHKKPSIGYGNNKTYTQEPSGSSSNSKPGSKVEQIDWSNLEKPNKKGSLVIDLSQLWYSTDRKNSNQNASRSKKRNASTDHGNNCYCTEYDECDPDGRVDVSHVFGSDNSRLRSMVVDCANENKICCLMPLRMVSQKPYGSDKYEIQGTDLRPTCGRKILKRTRNHETKEGLAHYGDFPWILRLITVGEDGEIEKSLCSASLIHSSVALTTASCALLLTGEDIRARAGEWNTGTGHERNKIQEAKVGKTFLHPGFDFATYTNDLALIFLDEAFDSNLGTNSVCLPSPNDAWDSSRCVVSGWYMEDVQGTERPVLTKTDLTNVIRGKCPNSSEHAANDAGTEDTRYICAYARNGDPCIADAGALMCPLYNSDMLVQIGFLSRSGICNEFYKTGTFIDIMESIDWITHMEGIYLYFRNKRSQQ